MEVVEAVSEIWGPDRVGVRLSPLGTFNDMGDDDPETTFGRVAEKLNGSALAYLHIVNPAVAAIEKGIEPDPSALRMLYAKDTAAPSSSLAVSTTTPRRAGSNKGRRI